MIHIQPNGCGYNGYTCVGAPTLSAMFVGNGLTCDDDYDRGPEDDWTATFTPPMPLAMLEGFLAPSHLSEPLWLMAKAETQEEYNTQRGNYQSWVYNYFRTVDYQSMEAQFGRAMADWLLHTFAGTALTDDPFDVDGVDPASVQPTLNLAQAYIQAQIDALEYEEDVPPFSYYAGIYLHGGNYIDNYLNLPVEFKGPVTTWSPVPDMGHAETGALYTLTAPEEECRDNYDAMTDGGFLDLFRKVYTAYPYQAAPVSRVIARSNSSDGPTAYVALINHLICFRDSVFEPGFIEPLLPVSNPVPAMPCVTGVDSAIDGAMLGIANLTAWKNIVNLWLNNTARSLMHIWGLRSLLIRMMRDTSGGDFTIEASNNNVLTWTTRSGTHSTPSFTVSRGTAYVNGIGIAVASLSSISAPSGSSTTYVWLNISLSDCDSHGQYGTVTAELSTTRQTGANKFSVGIGGIRRLQVSSNNGMPGYTLYQIIQERHSVAADIVRTCEEGVLYRLTTGASPYKVLAVVECDQ